MRFSIIEISRRFLARPLGLFKLRIFLELPNWAVLFVWSRLLWPFKLWIMICFCLVIICLLTVCSYGTIHVAVARIIRVRVVSLIRHHAWAKHRHVALWLTFWNPLRLDDELHHLELVLLHLSHHLKLLHKSVVERRLSLRMLATNCAFSYYDRLFRIMGRFSCHIWTFFFLFLSWRDLNVHWLTANIKRRLYCF